MLGRFFPRPPSLPWHARASLFWARVLRSWTNALPFHAAFSATLATTAISVWRAAPGFSPSVGGQLLFGAVALVTILGSWIYAGQSVRADFTRALGLRRAPRLMGGALLALLGITLVLGSPIGQRALLDPRGVVAMGTGAALMAGMATMGAFLLLAWGGRVGDAPRAPLAPSPGPYSMPKTALRGIARDLDARWQGLRHAWKHLPMALLVFVLALMAVSILTPLAASALSFLPDTLSSLLLGTLVLPALSLCPTAAAAVLVAPATPTDAPDSIDPTPPTA